MRRRHSAGRVHAPWGMNAMDRSHAVMLGGGNYIYPDEKMHMDELYWQRTGKAFVYCSHGMFGSTGVCIRIHRASTVLAGETAVFRRNATARYREGLVGYRF
jgi:hypothetical protein